MDQFLNLALSNLQQLIRIIERELRPDDIAYAAFECFKDILGEII